MSPKDFVFLEYIVALFVGLGVSECMRRQGITFTDPDPAKRNKAIAFFVVFAFAWWLAGEVFWR